MKTKQLSIMEDTKIINNEETNVAIESPAEQTTQNDMPNKENKKNSSSGFIISIILFVGLVLLYILHFAGIGAPKGNKMQNADAKAPVVSGENGLKIAFVNTDTLMEYYQYAKDLQKQLKDFQTAKQNSYTQQMNQFQKDYEAYVKGGADNMTLSQQQAKEKELQERAQRLQSLETEYASQVQEKTLSESEKMTQAVYNFIREYNSQNQQFDLILAKSFTSSPILYGNEGMDITDEIVKGLNEEYAKLKAEK